MPRRLIFITQPRSRLTETTTIEPGYSKGYSPDEMRMWAEDLDRYNRTPPADVEHWRSMAAHQLSPEQRRTLAVHDKYFVEAASGIRGSLRADQKVELDGGRHRAGYLLEQGVDPVPVWVWAGDQRQLEALEAQCAQERLPARLGAAGRVERWPRVALAEQHREHDREHNDDADTGADRVRT